MRGKYGALLLCLLAFASGCDLAEDDLYALRITFPEDEQAFRDSDDSDLSTPGMQISVRVETTEDEVPLELLRLTGGTPEIITRKLSKGRAADFSAVTLFPGPNRLAARDARSKRMSQVITAYFEDPCGAITFIEPVPPPAGNELLLGPPDGERCGQNYMIPLLASTGLRDGTRVSVLIGRDRVASGTTRGGTLQIAEVPIDLRDEQSFTLSLLVEDQQCAPVAFPAQVRLDCSGPTCILNPFEDRPYTSDDDQDEKIPGLNLDISVSTGLDGRRHPVELVINGDKENAYRAMVAEGTGQATFPGVSLPDGSVRVTAICRDDAGAKTSSQRIISVDTSGCTVSVTSPVAGTTFVAAEDGQALSVQVTAALGSDCASARFSDSATADCKDAFSDTPFQEVTLGQTTITADVSLSVHGSRFLCVGTRDASANESVVAVPVTFENKGPSLSITNPLGILWVNRSGDASHLADLDPSTAACERPVAVTCALDGKTVSLLRMPDKVSLAETTCVGRRAIFASVPLPSQNDGAAYWLEARTTSDKGLIGRSESLEVHADCEPPGLAFAEDVCGLSVIPASADEDPSAPGIQHTLRVRNTPNPKPEVTLTLAVQGQALPGSPLTSAIHDGTDTVFPKVTLPTGKVVVEACATDASGNSACSGDCELLVGNPPSVTLLEPVRDGAIYALDLSGSGVSYRDAAPANVDCSAAPGLQIPVRAQVANAAVGRAARVRLVGPGDTPLDEALTTVDANNEVHACLEGLEGVDGKDLVIRVEVDAASAATDGLYGAAARHFTIDTQAPQVALPSLALPAPCRGPSSLLFAAPVGGDDSHEALAFELRCADAPISTQAAWRNATVVAGEPYLSSKTLANNATAGVTMEWTLPPQRAGQTRHCSVRGFDRVGAYTPLGTSRSFDAPPLQQRSIVFASEFGGTFTEAPQELVTTALGDVNGDGFDDLLISGGRPRELGGAALYLGSADGVPGEPSTIFGVRDSYELGRSAVALGNFDQDPQGLMDFAVAAPLSGRVFVVLGRRDFPEGTLALDAGGCSADLCLVGGREFGRSLASARYDFDQVPDLAAADREGAVIMLGGADLTRIERLGASGAGACFDARSLSGPDACGTGSSQEARGFRVFAEEPIDHLLAPWHGALFLAHAGAASAPALWYSPARIYPRAGGLVAVPSEELTVVHEPGAPAMPGTLVQLGDVDADGVSEVGWGHGAGSGSVQVYRRNSAGTLTPAFTVSNDLTAGSDDAFGYLVATAAHPELGQYGDLDGDGRADLLVSAAQSLNARGTVDLFDDLTPFSATRPRSSRALHFDDATLPDSADADPSAYRREGQWIGDTDGDGQLDLAILEPDHGGGQGRLIVLGECGR